jgi:hypothetical protein
MNDMGAIAIAGGGAMLLRPGAMVRLNDVDNLRVLATNKGLLLNATDNGRNMVKLAWKAKPKAIAKAATKAAKVGAGASAVQAKAMAASAKSMADSAEALARAAKSMAAKSMAAKSMAAKSIAVPAKTVVATAGAAKAAGAGLWGGTGMGFGLGLGLGALGPVALLGVLAVSTGGVYFLLRGRQGPADSTRF